MDHFIVKVAILSDLLFVFSLFPSQTGVFSNTTGRAFVGRQKEGKIEVDLAKLITCSLYCSDRMEIAGSHLLAAILCTSVSVQPFTWRQNLC